MTITQLIENLEQVKNQHQLQLASVVKERDRYKMAIEDCLNWANGRQYECLEAALYPILENMRE